jgi:hypothetical protein
LFQTPASNGGYTNVTRNEAIGKSSSQNAGNAHHGEARTIDP